MSLPHQQSANTGVKPVQKAAYQPGATDDRSNAQIYRQNQINKQQEINGRKVQGGGGDTVVVPSFPSRGPPVSGGDSDANGSSQATNTTSTQSQANSVCDHCIGSNSNTPHCQSSACNPQAGGGSCNGNGLIGLNDTWNCMSGGKTRRRKGKKRKNTRKKKSKRKTKGKYKKKTKARSKRVIKKKLKKIDNCKYTGKLPLIC